MNSLTRRLRNDSIQSNIDLIEKFDPEKIITAVYLDTDKLQYNVNVLK